MSSGGRSAVNETGFTAVVLGASAGGMDAVSAVLGPLTASFPAMIFLVQHLGPKGGKHLIGVLERGCQFPVRFAEDKMSPQPGTVYVAPARHHLLVERDGCLALCVDEPVNHSRPSVDVLFESAAEAFQQSLIGIVLTGANSDGATGLRRIQELGGFVIVQSPETAEVSTMPECALRSVQPDFVAPPEEIGHKLMRLCDVTKEDHGDE